MDCMWKRRQALHRMFFSDLIPSSLLATIQSQEMLSSNFWSLGLCLVVNQVLGSLGRRHRRLSFWSPHDFASECRDELAIVLVI